MEIQKNSFLSIEQLADRLYGRTPRTDGAKTTEGLTFQEILEQRSSGETGALKLSKHAAHRLNDRGIELSMEQWQRLVIVDDLAFIVNVPNQTVVTAMDSTQTSENVFTNINGAVIM